MAQTQVNSATLVMGVTGSGKSSLARTLAEYLWETHKKVLYYYNCDGGGFPAKVQEGVALGIIKVWRMRTRDPGDQGLAFETCSRAAQGWWPRRINPSTGEVPVGVPMVAPITKRFEMICPNGHTVKSVIAQSLLTPQKCPHCQVMVTTQTMVVKETYQESTGFGDRGGVFYDGLSSMLSWELMEMGHRAGKLELKGEEAAIGGKITSGDLKYGGSTRSHVGFVQTRGEELAHNALSIPNLYVPPVFTALTMEVLDEGSLSVIGPKIAGRAKTDEAPQWFGNCLEAAKIPAEVGTGEQFVLYLSEFTDPQGRRHLLKHRGAPGTMPDKLMDPPNGTLPFSQFNLGLFFSKLNEALLAGIEAAKEQYPDAPGLPEGFVEFGDSTATVTPAAGPTPPAATAAPKASSPKAPAAAGTPRASSPATAPVAAAAPAPPAPPPVAPPAAPAAAAAPAKPAGAAPPPGRRPAPAASAPATTQVATAAVPKPPATAPRPPAAAPRAPKAPVATP